MPPGDITNDDFLALPDGRGGWYFLFGLHLPELPDFLADHTLLGEQPDERIREHCRRWTQFVGGLWTDRDVAYALRFGFDPAAGGTRLHLLARVGDPASVAPTLRDLERALTAFGVRHERTRTSGLQSLCPRPGRSAAIQATGPGAVQAQPHGRTAPARVVAGPMPHVFEVRQRDQQLLTRMGRLASEELAYLVLPWWGPGGPFLVPMDALVSQPVPVSLLVLLRPTALQTEDRRVMADLASRGTTAASTTRYQSDQRERSDHQADPQAEWLGRTYAANLRRLESPFLVAAYACSDDPGAARSVAMALAATISEEQPFEVPLGETAPLQSRAEAVLLTAPDHAEALLGYLAFRPGPSAHVRTDSDAEQRLRYLMDARGASSVFRLPVSVRGGVPGIAVRQQPPDFHPGPRLRLGAEQRRAVGLVEIGSFHHGGTAAVPLKDLTKHVLITGFTGSGKTRTLLHLLHQLWNDHGVPFLVLEPAKREYRGLLGVKKWRMRGPRGEDRRMRVYTLGNESCAPFRFNPFALQPGVRLEAHLGALQTCFEAAMPQIGPLPSILAEALDRVYRDDCGWLPTDAGPPAGQRSPLRFPTMSDLYAKTEKVIAERGYQGEILGNLQAAVAGRVKPLIMGSKGRMFDTQESIAAEDLFSRPVILEMNDLNEQDKSLVVMFLLTMLRQYREQNVGPRNELVHVTVLEEAHNVLENLTSRGAQEVGNDLRAKAVQSFCNMLAEVRAYGEGLIIADQSPEKLAPDAMRNTNVQIAHQLRDGHDREAMANAMIMTDEQRDFVGKLMPGRAAVFYTGLERATFVKVPPYDQPPPGELAPAEGLPGEGYAPPADGELKRYMATWTAGHAVEETRFGAACAACPRKCEYRLRLFGVCGGDRAEQFDRAYELYVNNQHAPGARRTFLTVATTLAIEATQQAGHAGDAHAGWCAFLHLMYRNPKRTADVTEVRQNLLDWYRSLAESRQKEA